MTWARLIEEIVFWPGRWLETLVAITQNPSILDVVTLTLVTVGAGFLMWVVIEMLYWRELYTEPSALFKGLGTVLILASIPLALLTGNGMLIEVALLAFPGVILWGAIVSGISYIARNSGESGRIYAGIIISIGVGLIIYAVFRALPSPWNTAIVAYGAVSLASYPAFIYVTEREEHRREEMREKRIEKVVGVLRRKAEECILNPNLKCIEEVEKEAEIYAFYFGEKDEFEKVVIWMKKQIENRRKLEEILRRRHEMDTHEYFKITDELMKELPPKVVRALFEKYGVVEKSSY